MYCSKCGESNPDDATFCKACGNDLKASSPPRAGPSPPSGTSQVGNATFRISTAFRNAIALVTNPLAFMKQNRDVSVTLNSIMINYVAVLAVVPFIAILIGDLWYFASGFAVVEAILTYILDVVGVFVIGIVIWKLAPYFGTSTDQTRATVLAAYVYTPVFLISILDIIPFIGFLTILGLLYGLYILYLGLPVMLNTPTDRVIMYVIAIVVASIVVYAVIAAIIGAVSAALFFRAFL